MMVVYKDETVPQALQREADEKKQKSIRNKLELYSKIRFEGLKHEVTPEDEYLELEKIIFGRKKNKNNNKQDNSDKKSSLLESKLSELNFQVPGENNKKDNKNIKIQSIKDAGKHYIGVSMQKQDYTFLDSNFYLLGQKQKENKLQS